MSCSEMHFVLRICPVCITQIARALLGGDFRSIEMFLGAALSAPRASARTSLPTPDVWWLTARAVIAIWIVSRSRFLEGPTLRALFGTALRPTDVDDRVESSHTRRSARSADAALARCLDKLTLGQRDAQFYRRSGHCLDCAFGELVDMVRRGHVAEPQLVFVDPLQNRGLARLRPLDIFDWRVLFVIWWIAHPQHSSA